MNVAAKVPAQITTLYIDDGTPVDSGSLIAAQDRSALDIQLRAAQAAVDQGARAAYVDGARFTYGGHSIRAEQGVTQGRDEPQA